MTRVIELCRDANINKKSIEYKIDQLMVKKACDEHSENSILLTIKSSCQLDKAILICFGKHYRATCENLITFQMLWERFKDLMRAFHIHQTGLHSIPVNESSLESLSNGSIPLNYSNGSHSNPLKQVDCHDINRMITLLTPPIEIFIQALDRLCDNGLIIRHVSNKAIFANIHRFMSFSLRSSPEDVMSSFRDDSMAVFI
jgi:hypothetical protein